MTPKGLRGLPMPERLLYTAFIILLATGYAFAQVLIYLDVAPEDGRPGLSARDIEIKYRGNRSGTALEQALMGRMRAYRTDEEAGAIVSWIRAGAPRRAFEEEIGPILRKRCVSCHNPSAAPGLTDLGEYESVKAIGDADRGEPVATLVRGSHIHLFGMAIIFYLLGRIFVLSGMKAWPKGIIVVLPFAAILMDIGSWWFTKFGSPVFAYTVMLGGALSGLCFAVEGLVSLYEIWLKGAGP